MRCRVRRRAPRRWRSFAATCAQRSAPTRSTRWVAAAPPSPSPLPRGQGWGLQRCGWWHGRQGTLWSCRETARWRMQLIGARERGYVAARPGVSELRLRRACAAAHTLPGLCPTPLWIALATPWLPGHRPRARGGARDADPGAPHQEQPHPAGRAGWVAAAACQTPALCLGLSAAGACACKRAAVSTLDSSGRLLGGCQ